MLPLRRTLFLPRGEPRGRTFLPSSLRVTKWLTESASGSPSAKDEKFPHQTLPKVTGRPSCRLWNFWHTHTHTHT